MNKYILLIIINAPLIMLGVISAVTDYKTSRISRNRCTLQVLSWLIIGLSLVMVQPVYDILIRSNLTESPPLSVFDIVLLSGVLFCLLLIKRTNEKVDVLSKKVSRMHENIVIAEEQRHWDVKKYQLSSLNANACLL
jgi:hypothetical protein